MKETTVCRSWHIPVAALLFLSFLTCPAVAGTLEGAVKGKGGELKRYVRVQIGGEETKTTFTDRNGRFSIEVRDGKYTVTITERNRSMRFEIDVPMTEEQKKEGFKLNW